MKKLCTLLALALSATTFGQSADEYLQAGIAKHNAQDYSAAIQEYSKAISADKNLRDAYYNRGVCELATHDLRAARKDIDQSIRLDPTFAKAYYTRATIWLAQEKYKEALPDLDKAIDIEPQLPSALTLRGQIRAQSGNKIGACEDFSQAKAYGDAKADKYLEQYCGNEQQAGESLVLDWPDAENWKIGDDQENAEQHVIDLIHTNESIDNWTELGNMTSIKGVKGVPVEKAMHLMLDQIKQGAPLAQLTFIEKDEEAAYPWIIFTIESPRFNNDPRPESQLWYIVQGKQGLYTNFWAIKKANITASQKAKWTAFFKTGKIVNR